MELEKDILNRLRLYVDDQLMNNLLRDAADEIERLRRRLELCSTQIANLKTIRDGQAAILAIQSSEAQTEPHSEESNPEGEA